MATLKSGLVAIVLVAGLAGSSQAQFVNGGFQGGGFATFPGAGVNSGYYSINSGFGDYGLPGAYPGYAGYGLSGYGPGATLNGYFGAIQPNLAPQTTNTMGGLMSSIRTQTGRGSSYNYGVNNGIPRRRGR
jgi:hypothetical protein